MDNYAFVRTSGYLPGQRRRLRLDVDGAQVRPAPRRRDHRPGAPAPRGRAQGEVQPAGQARHRQRCRPRGGQDAGRVQQADAALPLRAAAPRDHVDQPDRPRHRHRRADRQGPARPDRLAVQGRQDDDHAVDRQLDHHQQPRVPPDGRARRRASRGGHRLRALGQGRGGQLDVRPARPATTPSSRSWPSSAPSASSSSATTSSYSSTASPAWAAPTTSPHRRAAGSCPVVSTPPRSTRRSGSSVPRATSRTAAR